MKTLLLFAASILPLGILAQQSTEPTDLALLRASWTKARLQATAPIDQKYLQALEALKVQYTRAGKLEEALSVDAEMKAMVTPQNSKGAEPIAADKKLTRTILCDGTWTYHIPAEGRSWTYEFSQDRKVLVDKKAFGNWSLTSNVLRVENDDGRLWMEFSLNLKSKDQGKLYVEEISASKGTRSSVTLTQQ